MYQSGNSFNLEVDSYKRRCELLVIDLVKVEARDSFALVNLGWIKRASDRKGRGSYSFAEEFWELHYVAFSKPIWVYGISRG